MMAVCASAAGDFDHGVASMSKQQFSERLCAWIDQHFEEEVAVLQQLIRIPTDTRAGQQCPARRCGGRAGAILGLAGREARGAAEQVRDYGMQSITNLIVRRPYGDGGPTLALNAHGDVVPPGEGWTHDPYGGEVADGRIYGRAAAVSKSDFASYIFATRALEPLGCTARCRRAALYL
jgi:acetylornithine deacetylase/succinyl-diaminopimelate desuccinylase-like protein